MRGKLKKPAGGDKTTSHGHREGRTRLTGVVSVKGEGGGGGAALLLRSTYSTVAGKPS